MNRYRHISPAERAEIWRRVKSRSHIENGVITVHFVKILPGPERPHCEISNCTAEANYHYNGGQYCAQHRPAPDYHGPERPEQWTPGQCVECGLPCEPGFFLHNDCLKPIHARYFQEGA